MSEPIVKSAYYKTNIGDTADDYAARKMRAGYIAGQKDIVSAGYVDMSHYRRRSPSEKPEATDYPIIVETKQSKEYGFSVWRSSYVIDWYESLEYKYGNIISWWPMYVPEADKTEKDND